nr:ATP-binding protein [Stutzerimonas stutzeri]
MARLSNRIISHICSTAFTALTAYNLAGHGLGLAIVRSVMNLHKGHVAVASKDGRTTFELTFPRQA